MSFMRRVLLPLLLLLALVAVPAAHAASADKVIRDCTDDEQLQGTYTQKELANALAKLGADSAEYTNCAQVIHNAQLALASGGRKSSSGGTTNGGGTGTGTGSTPAGGTATTPSTTTTTPATSGNAPGAFGGFSGYPKDPAAATKEQRAAITQAQDSPVAEQRTELASTTLPGPVIALLAAGGVGLLVLLLLDLRRRVLARRG